MFPRRKKKPTASPSELRHGLIETLECRTLLSAGDAVMQPDIVINSAASVSSAVQGYTPSEIRNAYGFSNISLLGQGQTIAIIDAYNDPNISSDLSVFDSQFGLAAPPSFKVVNQTGGSSLPSTDAGWAGEISLDVEWAHAIAPQANILLVEATSSNLTDLMSAVKYARSAAGVSVVSMSWGGSEFFSWGGGEFASQTTLDSVFTTPAGHQGVTFVASAGDSGQYGGVQWPASSPNVLSVGGTTLTLDSSGNYVSEQSWSGTSGGYSQVESQPSYQNGVQNTGVRIVPDVAYNADPNTGFAVYDSVADQGLSGWQEVGGTSAGSPQWAALIALADQARVSAGQGTLDGVSQTLPLLYSLYSAPGTSGYTGYTSDFNDVIDSFRSSPWRWGWGWGYSQSQATAGYDTVTGLGTPHADQILSALGVSASSSSGSSGSSGSTGSSGSSGSTTPTPATLPASPISGVFLNEPPSSALSGQSGSLKLALQNTSASQFDGPLVVTLYASSDNTLSSDDTVIATLTLPKVKIAGGHSKTVFLKFAYPSGLPSGDYSLIASMNASETNTNPTTAVTATTVAISPPTVDLATAFASSTPIVVAPGKHDTAIVTVENLGNTVAAGTFSLSLYASANQALDAADTLLISLNPRRIKLKPHQALTLHIHFIAPLNATPGTYSLIASTTSSTQPADTNSSNDTAVIGTAS